MNIYSHILGEFISLKLRKAYFWSKSHFYTMYSLQKVRLILLNNQSTDEVETRACSMQVLWPIGPEVDLRYPK